MLSYSVSHVVHHLIRDMESTVDTIVAASTLPMSIIIIDVGKADFTSMNKLDSDDAMLFSDGRFASRDIV